MAPAVVMNVRMTGRDALLAAFDQLFDAAAARLEYAYTPEERVAATESFRARFAPALELTSHLELPALPEEAIAAMRQQIADLSPADIAGVLATIPLAQATQDMLRLLSVKQAEQRMLEHFASQAETRYGGN